MNIPVAAVGLMADDTESSSATRPMTSAMPTALLASHCEESAKLLQESQPRMIQGVTHLLSINGQASNENSFGAVTVMPPACSGRLLVRLPRQDLRRSTHGRDDGAAQHHRRSFQSARDLPPIGTASRGVRKGKQLILCHNSAEIGVGQLGNVDHETPLPGQEEAGNPGIWTLRAAVSALDENPRAFWLPRSCRWHQTLC